MKSSARQDEDELQREYADARERVGSGLAKRIAYAAIGSAMSGVVLGPRSALAQMVLVLVWEALTHVINNQLDRLAARGSLRPALWGLAVSLVVSSAAYSVFAVTLFFQGSLLAIYLSIIWIIGTLVHVFVFSSNSRATLWPQAAIPAVLLVLQPFTSMSDLVSATTASVAFIILVYAFVSFAAERNKLLEQVALEERQKDVAEAASEAKSQFLAVMSHELRTPLNAIIGFSEIMREDAVAAGRSGDVDDHDRVLRASRRLLHQISNILDLTRIEGGKAELEIGQHDVAAVVEGVVEIARPLAAENGNELVVDVGCIGPPVSTDAFKLSQCLLNLLANAAKFTRNGAIRLSVRREREAMTFEVADTGVGIPAHKIDSIFEPFTQADSSTTRTYGGSGLGLAITRGIARMLGGDVTVTSVEGVGSRFVLTVAADVRYDSPPHTLRLAPTLNLAAAR